MAQLWCRRWFYGWLRARAGDHGRIGLGATQTGKALGQVLLDMERDIWMGAQEAIDYAIVSRLVDKQTEIG